MSTTIALAGLAALVFAACLGLLGVVRRWAERRRLLDIPNPRSSHTTPTPRGGGLAIVAAGLGGWLLSFLVFGVDRPGAVAAYLAGAALVAGVSWLDDLRSLSHRVRLAAHALAGVAALAVLGAWSEVTLPGLGTLRLGWAGPVLSLVWIVGLTNAYNFMDGIDGIAGSQGVVAGLGWGALAWVAGDASAGVLAGCLAVSCAGFLRENWPPARIFMGDVGSAFLGFTFAVLPLLHRPPSAWESPGPHAVLGILAVWPFVFDTAFTVLRRIGRRERLAEAHRTHLYQRLAQSGWSHGRVSALYAALALLGVTVGGLWWRTGAGGWVVLVPAAAAGLWGLVRRQERLGGLS